MDILTNIWHVYQALCVIFTTLFLFRIIRAMRNKSTDVDIARAMNTIKLVHIESVNNTVCMYDSVNKTFLCQADTTETLWTVAKDRWPNHKFIEIDLDKLQE